MSLLDAFRAEAQVERLTPTSRRAVRELVLLLDKLKAELTDLPPSKADSPHPGRPPAIGLGLRRRWIPIPRPRGA